MAGPVRRLLVRIVDSTPVVFLHHLVHVVCGCWAYAIASRRVSLLIAVVIGLAALAIGLAGQAAAPFVVYPFV
jgi:TctA family transporter